MDANIKVNEHLLSATEKETAVSSQLQSKRINFAHSFQLINENTSKSFKKLDSYRHKYIHPNRPISQYNISGDAKNAILKLHEIIRTCFPLLIEPVDKEKLKRRIIDHFIQNKI